MFDIAFHTGASEDEVKKVITDLSKKYKLKKVKVAEEMKWISHYHQDKHLDEIIDMTKEHLDGIKETKS
jgi:hypothetical protein